LNILLLPVVVVVQVELVVAAALVDIGHRSRVNHPAAARWLKAH
jgi:hypothetical protein